MNPPPLQSLLRDTSRSFYLTMRVLPGAIRPQISLAYLLARAADTVADTELVPVESRLRALADLRGRVAGASTIALDFGPLARSQALPAEQSLLERVGEALRALEQFSKDDQRLVREVLDIIISGQELDLKRFAPATPPRLAALETDAELDDYTWRVAGCVGEFWTRVCRARLFSQARVDDAMLLRDGVRFGKGLQLVNILRDIPRDLRQGRCYIPREALKTAGLTPEDLLSPQNEPRFRPLHDRLLDRAGAHLAAGWDYANALPAGQLRLRLACAWPVLIGVKTLRKLRVENVLDSSRRVKVTRGEVRGILVRSLLLLAWPAAWRNQFAREAAPRNEVDSPQILG